MRKASRIYKRKSRSNLETLIILIGAIIILGVAFHLARDKSYAPPETPVIAEKEEQKTLITETPIEMSQEITVEKVKEEEKITSEEIEKEITPPEKPLVTGPVIAKAPEVESEIKVLKEPEKVSERKIYTVQVGAFSSQKNAQSLAKEIRDKGYQTYVIKGKTLYKVQVGEFKDYEDAQKLSQELKKLGYPIFVTTRQE